MKQTHCIIAESWHETRSSHPNTETILIQELHQPKLRPKSWAHTHLRHYNSIPSQIMSLQGHSSVNIAHSMLLTPIIPKSIATPSTNLYQPIIGCPFLDNAGFTGNFFFLFFPLLVSASGSSFTNSLNKNSQCSFHHSGFHT